MASVAKWVAGAFQAGAWGTSAQSGFATADITLFNSLADGSAVVASTTIANSTNLDLLGEVSVSLVSSAATVTTSYISVYVMPLNQDGTTYGDNTPSGSKQTVVPGQSYLRKVISIRSGIAAGTALVGVCEPFALPRGDFRLAIANNTGGTLASAAAAVISLRTTNEQFV